jgi:hypothetical protein
MRALRPFVLEVFFSKWEFTAAAPSLRVRHAVGANLSGTN